MKNNIIIGVAIAILLVGCATFAVCATSDNNENPEMTTSDSGNIIFIGKFPIEHVEAPDGNHINSEVDFEWISCDGYTKLKYSTSSNNCLKVVDYNEDDKDFIKVPDYVVYNRDTYVIDEIGYYGLSTYYSFGKHPINVELGPNIINIKRSAFDCSVGIGNTYSVTFRDVEISKLEYIGMSAFKQCGFTTLELPSGVTYIGDEAFYYSQLTDLEFTPAELVEVCSSAFDGCKHLKSFPFEMASYIGDSAFNKCGFMNDANLKNCKYIGACAFMGSGISHVKFGNALEHIDIDAFDHDFYDAYGNKLDYNDPSSFWGKEFYLLGEKFVAVQ